MESLQEGLAGLNLAVKNNDAEGVADWFKKHPTAKVQKGKGVCLIEGMQQETLCILKQTAQQGSSKMFEALLENIYVQYEPCYIYGESMLQFLLREGTTSCLEIFLKRICDVNEIRSGILSMLAIKPIQVEKIKSLIARGANIDKEGTGNDFLNDILHYVAADDNDVDIVPSLLELGAEVNSPTIHTNLTPVYIAVYQNRPRLVDYLLENGANPRIRTCEGETAVTCAIYNPSVLRIFLEKNFLMTEEGDYLLAIALYHQRNTDMMSVKLLLQTGSRCSREEWAMIRSRLPVQDDSQELKLPEIENLLEQYAFQPRSLLDLACFRIREILSTELHGSLNSLPIPDFMKRCVKLEHYLGVS